MRLNVHDLAHRFGDGPWLFSGMNLTLLSGRSYAITGPSGSGKTTFLSLLGRQSDPASGSVSFSEPLRTQWVFQQPIGVPQRSALDHVCWPSLGRGYSRTAAAQRSLELLSQFDLLAVRDVAYHALSGGQAQRLMLACALAADPDLLLVDEPTAQLDSVASASVNAALRRVRQAGTIVVVATHDTDTRASCSDQIDMAHFAPLARPS